MLCRWRWGWRGWDWDWEGAVRWEIEAATVTERLSVIAIQRTWEIAINWESKSAQT